MPDREKKLYRRTGAAIKRSNNKSFLAFSVLFLVVGFFVFLPYFANGRSLICSGDAAVQHYPALSYYGSYLRSILRTLWQEHRLVIPTWDMGIGYGGDIITTLHYYCLGDPLTLLSVFFSEGQTELCYNILVVLRLYLSGISMLCYCKHRKLEDYASVIGALIYSFSGYAVSAGVFHPFFAIPMIYLPLLLLGADLLFENKNPLLFILSVAFALLSNFYFFYMLVIIVVLYALLRYFSYYGKFDFSTVIRIFGRFLSCAVIGVLIAMPVFLPNLLSLLQSNRVSVERQIPLFYPPAYYRDLFEGIISEFGMYYVYISISPVAIAALFTMLSRPYKENRWLIIAVAVLFSFLLIPAVGSIFNGFNYVTNRWIWALIFVLSYITAKNLPKTEELTKGQWIKILAFSVVFFLLCYIPDHRISKQTVLSFAALFGCIAMAVLISQKRISKRFFRGTMIVLTIGTLVVNGYFHASGRFGNWVGNSQLSGEAYSRYYQSVVKMVDELPNEGAGRFDSAKGAVDYNAALLHDIGGTGFYFSTINPGTAQFQREQMMNCVVDQQFSGLDGRSYLAAALSVAYYISDEQEAQPKPYGYDQLVADHVYTSSHTLPLVYAFDTVYTGGESLTVTQKQQALLQRAMTDETFGLPDQAPEFSDRTVPYRITQAKDVSVGDGSFAVEKPGATLTLSFDGVTNSELYCIFEGLEYESDDHASQVGLEITCDQVSQTLQYKTPYDNYTSDRHDFLVNLGYSEKSRTELTISFNRAGTIRFSEFSIVAQPMEDFFDRIDQLAHSGISDIAVENGQIFFSSDRKTAGIACIAVPFQEGWSAKVDGKKAEVLNIQGGLCGIYLDAGQHDVVLSYKNPVTNLSFALCIFGIGLLGFVMFQYKKQRV